jgi:hypothetical protein
MLQIVQRDSNNLKGVIPTLITQMETQTTSISSIPIQTTTTTTTSSSIDTFTTLTIEQKILQLEQKHLQEIEDLKKELEKQRQLEDLQSRLQPSLEELCKLGADQLSPELLYELLQKHRTQSIYTASTPPASPTREPPSPIKEFPSSPRKEFPSSPRKESPSSKRNLSVTIEPTIALPKTTSGPTKKFNSIQSSSRTSVNFLCN